MRAAIYGKRAKCWCGAYTQQTRCFKGFGHTEGVRLGDEQVEVSPIREEFLKKRKRFYGI